MSKDIPRNRSETASSIGKLLTDRQKYVEKVYYLKT